MLALLLPLLAQPQALELSTVLDRPRVNVGEEFVFTLRAIGHSTAPFRVELPPLDGLALVERIERTDVVVGTGQTTRAFTLELRLRAEQVGLWSIGPLRVEQGDASAFSSPASINVTSSSSGSASGPDPDLLALLPRVPPPRPGRPSVYAVVSDEQVFAGDQLNILTAAWLPRGLRLQLRQAPTLTPPSLAGVWSAPRQAVSGAVASRIVDGESYDLYVSFQTAYPLNPGPLAIPSARLVWVIPGRQTLSAERRESAESAPLRVTVLPLPAAGRPAGFGGPVARELLIDYELGASSARAGAALRVTVVVSGSGNLPLWPPPTIAWPGSVRVYQEGSEDLPRLLGLQVGGSKRFRFGIVPDSAGSLALPPLDYPYFDPVAAVYRSAHAPAIVVPVLEAAPVTDRRDPLPIEEPTAQPLADRLLGRGSPALALLVALPLLVIAGVTLWRRRSRAAQPAPEPSPAARLEAVIRSLVPPGTPAAPRALARALRAAGVERREAVRLVRLHLALEADRFGPTGVIPSDGVIPSEARDLSRAQEIEAVLAALPARLRRAGVRAALWLGALLAATALAPGATAQSGVELYARGEYAAAARAFRAELGTAPPTPARWYDLAAAEYLALRDAHAVAALLPAREHAPRDRYVRALWSALAREHEQLRRAGRSWPLSAEEAFALALAALWLGAGLFVAFRRQRILWATVFALAAGCVLAGLGLRVERAGRRAVLAGGVSLRTSPHGLAPERGSAPGFSVVRLQRPLGAWWLVRTRDGAEGWIPAEILALVPALD